LIFLKDTFIIIKEVKAREDNNNKNKNKNKVKAKKGNNSNNNKNNIIIGKIWYYNYNILNKT